jgi:hypothetical protein
MTQAKKSKQHAPASRRVVRTAHDDAVAEETNDCAPAKDGTRHAHDHAMRGDRATAMRVNDGL